MEETLVRALTEIELGYKGAQLRRHLHETGITTRGELEKFLKTSNKPDEVRVAVQQGKVFLDGRPEQEAEAVYREKLLAVRSESDTILYLINAVVGEIDPPTNSRLQEWMGWAAQFISP